LFRNALVHDGDEFLPESARVLIDRHNLRISTLFTVRGMTPQMNHIAASPDGNHLVYDQHALPGTALYVCKLNSPQPWIERLAPRSATAITFSPDSEIAYIVANRCSALDVSVWPPVQVPCSSPDFEAAAQTAIAASPNGLDLACGYTGEVWLSRRIPESPSPIICHFPPGCEISALCQDGSCALAWMDSGPSPPASTPAQHLLDLYRASTSAANVVPQQTEVAEQAHYLCSAYYRGDSGSYRQPLLTKRSDAFFWLNAERFLRIRHSQSTLVLADHRAARLTHRTTGPGALIEYRLEHPHAVRQTVFEMKQGESAIALSARADLSWCFAVQAPDGPVICDTSGNRFAPTYVAPSSSYDKRIALWGAFSPGARLFAFQTFVGTGQIESIANVIICDLDSPASKPLVLANTEVLFTAVAFHPLGTRIALGLPDRRVEATLKVPYYRDDELVFVNSSVLLYDLTNHASPLVLTGGAGDVTTLAFSHDGAHLAAGTSNGSIAVYQTGSRRLPLHLHGHTGPVLSLSCS
jgi:hypothetical protein